MQEALLEMPNGVLPLFEPGALGALFEPSSTLETKQFSSDEKLIAKLISVLDSQLLEALDSRSVAEFRDVRKRVFPRYMRALRALSDTVSNLESEAEIEGRARHAISQLAADLEKQRGSRFDDNLVEQALFTLWTVGKIRILGRDIYAAGKPKDESVDMELSADCRMHSLWAQFHMDTVIAAMKFRKKLSAEIQKELSEGMRAIVNAYAVMKEALKLRLGTMEEPPVTNLPWDDEDERLLAASMRDMNAIIRASGN
jgi:hypothetical protein